MPIDILMATYNGGKYLENQLLSLLGQTYRDWILYIHDDGSDDATLDIIRKYQDLDTRILLISDNIRFGNAARNFMHLLHYSTSYYTIFCDQDDIWFETKLADLIEKLNMYDDEPCAVFCNGYAYSQEKGIIGDKITKVHPNSLNDFFFLNAGIQGCSLMFNRRLREKLNVIPNEIAMHDHFLTLGALCFGKLVYLDKHLMLYRQFHTNKATTNINYSLKKRLLSFFSRNLPVVDRLHFLATHSFYNSYKNKLEPKARLLFEAYLRYCNTSSLLKKVMIIGKYGFKLHCSRILLILKTIVRPSIK